MVSAHFKVESRWELRIKILSLARAANFENSSSSPAASMVLVGSSRIHTYSSMTIARAMASRCH